MVLVWTTSSWEDMRREERGEGEDVRQTGPTMRFWCPGWVVSPSGGQDTVDKLRRKGELRLGRLYKYILCVCVRACAYEHKCV